MVGLPADSLVSLGSDVQGCVPEQIKRMYVAKYDFTLSVPRGAIRFGRTTFRIDCFTRITELEEQATPQVTARMYLILFTQWFYFPKKTE